MKYIRKPVEVEAVQFLGGLKPWPKGVGMITPHWKDPHDAPLRWNFIWDGFGVIKIHSGDWIVTNQTGERYVVREASFNATYERL